MTAKQLFVSQDASIREALRIINDSGKLIALVIGEDDCLVGTVTDGDVRRGILRGFDLDDPVSRICKCAPVTATLAESRQDILRKMRAYSVHQMPVVDEIGRVIRVDFADEHYLFSSIRNNLVVLMAGGLGKRLRPLTEDCPKPMLCLGDKPIIRHIIENFMHDGFYRFLISLNYRGDMIEEHFGNGSELGCEITYLHEDRPLGTAGALSILPRLPEKPFFVMNADLLTSLNFVHLMDFHTEQQGAATICVKEYCYEVPYGVVQTDDHRVIGLTEKPIHRFQVNAGIYMLDPVALKLLDADTPCDMTTLIQRLVGNGYPVLSFPVMEDWLDVGRMSDFEKAQCEYANYRRGGK